MYNPLKEQLTKEAALEDVKVEHEPSITKFFPEFGIEDINTKFVTPELPPEPEKKFIEQYAQRIKKAIVAYLDDFDMKGATIGISGGIDSAMCLKLTSDALRESGVEKELKGVTFGKITREQFEKLPELQMSEIKQLAESSGSSMHELVDLYWASRLHQDYSDLHNYSWEYIDIKEPFRALSETLKHKNIFANKELLMRLQALMINQVVQENDHMYFGTTNRTENLLGALTIGGPWGYMPLQDGLYKTETYYLAKEIGVPSQFIRRRAINAAIGDYDDHLYGGKSDLKGLDFYRIVDPILFLYDKEYTAEKAAELSGHDIKFVKAIYQRVLNNSDRRYPRHVVIDPEIEESEAAYYNFNLVKGGQEERSRFVDQRKKVMGTDEDNLSEKWEDISELMTEGRSLTFKELKQ